MAGSAGALERKSFFVDARVLRRARRALGARTDSEAVREALRRAAENEELWRLMRRTAGSLGPGAFGKV
ncbi:MAG: hypothetical protein HYZ28_14580 [Myxococcales bacterium]|nr:hypothetical protein [Myxococcales bacterium]